MGNGRWSLLTIAALCAALFSGCTLADSRRTAVEFTQLPDARQTLAEAWQVEWPDQPLPFSIPVRRRLFAFQVLLISAGMYNEPPSDPAAVNSEYALDVASIPESVLARTVHRVGLYGQLQRTD